MHLHFIFVFFFASLDVSSSQPYHLHHYRPHPQPSEAQESLELTPPLPTSNLPPPSLECTHLVLNSSFANTTGQPPLTVPYSSPPDCPPPWSHAVLHLSGTVSGHQYDRIAAVWLAGDEILRTSTPQPYDYVTFWDVRKDIIRYSSLLQQSNVSISMMLENFVNTTFTGVYHVALTILFYKVDGVVGSSQNECFCEVTESEGPADLVIPISKEGNQGFWFQIEDEATVASKSVMIPMNARKAVLEVYVSYHGDDEFWYSNPPNRYIVANNLNTGRGNGAFREVFVRVDGNYVASEVPFPVVFTGGVNPFFWEPVVAIGAFNLPSYDFDLTPFLGLLSDGESHNFDLGVAHANYFWLVGANVHVWLDKRSSKVEAQLSVYQPPVFSDSWVYSFNELDGLFEIETERMSKFSGWVAFSCGNLTTTVTKRIVFRNSVRFQRNGTYKMVKQKVNVKTEVRILSEAGATVSRRKVKRKFPLLLITSTMPGIENDTYFVTTNISLSLREKDKVTSRNGKLFSSIHNSQESGGWMLVKDDDSVLTGFAETRQTLNYRSNQGCYLRSVEAIGGELVGDNSTSICPSIFLELLNMLFGTW